MCKIPQFDTVTGELIMVDMPDEQYNVVKLTPGEAELAIRDYKRKNHLLTLTVEQMALALRIAREKKHFNEKLSSYFKKVNNKHPQR